MARRPSATTKAELPKSIDRLVIKEAGQSLVSEFLECIRRLSRVEQKTTVQWCRHAVTARGFISLKRNRIGLAKLLVSLLPDSHEIIRHALTAQNRSYCRELQFSLFCFLDEVQDHAALLAYKPKVLKLIFDYLVTVRSNQAQAAWMAGDLLGDHWDLNEASRVVAQAKKIVRFSAGKEALTHAATQIKERLDSLSGG